MVSVHVRAILIAICLLAAVSICVPPATAAERRIGVQGLSGSGVYATSLDDLDDEFGPLSYVSQQFDWRLVVPQAGRTTLRLPERGGTRLRMLVEMHVVSSGGGIFFDLASSPPRTIQYTCQAERTYRARSLIEVRRRANGWRAALTPATELLPGAPTCEGVAAEDVLWSWPTGTDWFAATMRRERPLTAKQAGGGTLSYASGPRERDCTEVPGVTHRCVETLTWTARVRLVRSRATAAG
jgi:hypothetical protein